MKQGDIVKAFNPCTVGFDMGVGNMARGIKPVGRIHPDDCALILEVNNIQHNHYAYSFDEVTLLTGSEICYAPLEDLEKNFYVINEEEIKECQKKKN